MSRGRGPRGGPPLPEGANVVYALLDLTRPPLAPVLLRPARNLVANLVYAETGRNVVLSMVAGRVIYRDGRFTSVDADQVRRDVQAAADRLQQATAADERTRDLPIVDLTRRGLA